jgi:hypothetical protein
LLPAERRFAPRQTLLLCQEQSAQEFFLLPAGWRLAASALRWVEQMQAQHAQAQLVQAWPRLRLQWRWQG